MKYTKFILENFRGIKHIEVLVNNTPISFVGINESGKTSILQGIHAIGRHIKEWDYDNIKNHKPLLSNGELKKNIPKKNDLFSGDISLCASLQDSQNNKIDISMVHTITKNKCGKIKLTIQKNGTPIEGSAKKALFNEIQKNSPDIYYYDKFDFEVPEQVYFITEAERVTLAQKGNELKNEKYYPNVANILNKNWCRILDDILRFHRYKKEINMHGSFQEDIVDYDEKKQIGDTSGLLFGLGSILTQEIVKKWHKISKKKKIQEIQITENKKVGGYLSYFIRVRTEDDSSFAIQERSLGFRWFFCFILLTEFRKLRKENTIFLLDEPASNLHATAQEQILQAINQITKNAYVMYSTHSPYLLDIHNMNEMYIVRDKNDRPSQTKEPNIVCENFSEIEVDIKTIPKSHEYLRPILDYLYFTLPNIYSEANPSTTEGVSEKAERSKKIINVKKIDKSIKEKIIAIFNIAYPKVAGQFLANIFKNIIS